MNYLAKVWKYLNLLSIDVVLGSMAGMLFFSDILKVKVPFLLYLLLGMAVWVIYTSDHLVDAARIEHRASSERHRFHQDHIKLFSALVLIVVLTGFAMVYAVKGLHFIFFPSMYLGTGMVIVMGLLHFFNKNVAWLKEVCTAIFYVLGIALGPFMVSVPNEIPIIFYLIMGAYFLLALLNLFILSLIDQKSDQVDGLGSALQLVSKSIMEKLVQIIGVFAGTFLLILLVLAPSYHKIHAVILLLIVLFHLKEYYKDNNIQLREKLEASFSIPFLLLLF